MARKIFWKTPKLFKADPEKVYEELQTLDEITPDSVLELARNENSVLHNEIDWNDRTAAEKWRKQQARLIVCNLVVKVEERKEEEPVTVRLFHNIDSDKGKTYEPITVIVKDEDKYKNLLDQAKRELHSFQVKYHSLKELEPVFKAINEL